ncbi:PHD-type domain-containing protein [Entamoeba marina]
MSSSPFSLCCVSNCQNIGSIPLKQIEGTLLIKYELNNTKPSSWKLCEFHFKEQLKMMCCCVVGCKNIPTPHILPETHQDQRKPECCHYQICDNHYRTLILTSMVKQQPTKRSIENETKFQSKRTNFIEDENSRTISENNSVTTEDKTTDQLYLSNSNIQFQNILSNDISLSKNDIHPFDIINHDEIIRTTNDEILQRENHLSKLQNPFDSIHSNSTSSIIGKVKHCCFTPCEDLADNQVELLLPLNVPICLTHSKIIIKLMRKALLEHQLVLSQQQLELLEPLNKLKFNPLSNYNKTGSDGKCALCFGYRNKKPIYSCGTCSRVYCAECQKYLQEHFNTNSFQQPASHRKCVVCLSGNILPHINSFREKVLTKHLQILIKATENRMKLFYTTNFIDIQEKMKNEESQRQEVLKNKQKHLQHFIQYLKTIFPETIKLRLSVEKQCKSTHANSIFLFSNTLTNYFLCSQINSTETLAQHLHSLANINTYSQIKEINHSIDFQTTLLGHSKDYIDILQTLFNNSEEKKLWTIRKQLTSYLSQQSFQSPNYSLTLFDLTISLQLCQAVCDAIQILNDNNEMKNAFIYTGIRGGVIPYNGVLIKQSFDEKMDGKMVFKLTPNENNVDDGKSLVMIMKKNPLEFPQGIEATIPISVLTSSFFLNYTAIGVNYAIEKLNYKKIVIIIHGNEDDERETINILDDKIKNNTVLIINLSDEWSETFFNIKMFQPQLIIVCLHCEICDKQINSGVHLHNLTKYLENVNSSKTPCKIITLIQHGILLDNKYEKYKNYISEYIQSLNK